MSSVAVEKKTCQCVCERSEEGGECVCVCTVPCSIDAENQIVEWTCDCKCGDGSSCRCTFQLKCNRKPGDKCCGGGDSCERNTFTCKCRCSSGECTVQINKCKCCEVIRVECGGESADGGSCGKGEAGAGKACCKGGAGPKAGGCC